MSLGSPTAILITNVFGYVFEDDGVTPVENASIKFTSKPFMLNDNLVAIHETALSDATGLFQKELPRTEETGTLIDVEIVYTASDNKRVKKTESIITGTTTPISVQAARAIVEGDAVITGGPQGATGATGATGAPGTVAIIAVADIDAPDAELNLLNASSGSPLVTKETMGAGAADEETSYIFDLDGPVVNSPYVIATLDGGTTRWIAIGGKYDNNERNFNNNIVMEVGQTVDGQDISVVIPPNTTHRTSDGTDHSDVVLNNTHRSSDGTDHSNVVLNDTHRASDGTDHSNVVLNDTHRASDGTDHSNVVLNDTHRASDGTDHSDVVLNTTHRGSSGTDHSDVVLNTTHRTSDGTDHSNVVLNDTHRASNGTDHANVVLNDTHRGSNGTDHSNVVLNDTHRASNGTDHSNVVLNDTHRASAGTDHSDVVLNNTHRGVVTGNPHSVDITEAVTASGTTDITEAELETLSDDSNANGLHFHYRERSLHFKDKIKGKTTSFVDATSFIWPGTAQMPTFDDVRFHFQIMNEVAARTGDWQVVDRDNGDAVIATATTTATVAEIVTDTTITNLPTTLANFYIQGKTSVAGDDAQMVELMMIWNEV